MLSTSLKHIYGLIETALFNANKAESIVNVTSQTIMQTEDALCEVDDNVTTMLAEIQDALCELDEKLSKSEE